MSETIEHNEAGFSDHPFVLCLTHDVDRPYKTYQGPYYALAHRNVDVLVSGLGNEEPYWQFEEIMALEEAFGVRSSFYFLHEQHLLRDKSPRHWLQPANWIRHTGYYRLDDPAIAEIIRDLDAGGWEVGLHGSFDSYDDPDRLAAEKALLEEVLGHSVAGCRQHYLNLGPNTWRYQRNLGFSYDASLGSSEEVGFAHGYNVIRPFADDFCVYPLTVMEVALLDRAGSVAGAKSELDRLLTEAREHGAMMSALWHPRLFNSAEFPGYRELYTYLIERALDMGAWIGPIGDVHDALRHHTIHT